MANRLTQIGCFFALLLACGCTGKQGLPPDPLFAERKPIETKAQSGPPIVTPFTDPMPAVNKIAGDPPSFGVRIVP